MDVGSDQGKVPRGAGLTAALSGFWSWWTGTLLSLVPSRWQAWLRGRGEGLLLEYTGESCKLRHLSSREGAPLGELYRDPERPVPGMLIEQLRQIAKQNQELVLALQPDHCLRKTLTLPVATETRLRDVLGYEMDRHTPFRAEDVFYDHRVLSRDPSKQKLKVELVLTGQAFLQPLLDWLDEYGLRPTRVTVSGLGPVAGKGTLDLRRKHDGQEVSAGPKPSRLIWGGVLLVLLAIWVMTALHQRESRVEELTQAVAEAREGAMRAQQAREQIDAIQESRRFLSTRKREEVPMVLLWQELTRLLPDNTWLNRLELRGDQVRLQGESATASALISQVDGSPLLGQVSFSSPVTVNPRTQKERFVIEAQLESGMRSEQVREGAQ